MSPFGIKFESNHLGVSFLNLVLHDDDDYKINQFKTDKKRDMNC